MTCRLLVRTRPWPGPRRGELLEIPGRRSRRFERATYLPACAAVAAAGRAQRPPCPVFPRTPAPGISTVAGPRFGLGGAMKCSPRPSHTSAGGCGRISKQRRSPVSADVRAVLRTAQALAPERVSALLLEALATCRVSFPATGPCESAYRRCDADRDPCCPCCSDLPPDYAGARPGSFKKLLDGPSGGGEINHEKPLSRMSVANDSVVR